jgi:hypothetical protein
MLSLSRKKYCPGNNFSKLTDSKYNPSNLNLTETDAMKVMYPVSVTNLGLSPETEDDVKRCLHTSYYKLCSKNNLSMVKLLLNQNKINFENTFSDAMTYCLDNKSDKVAKYMLNRIDVKTISHLVMAIKGATAIEDDVLMEKFISIEPGPLVKKADVLKDIKPNDISAVVTNSELMTMILEHTDLPTGNNTTVKNTTDDILVTLDD